MESDDVTINQKIEQLSDLELATLLCLINDEHCLIATDAGSINLLEQELRLIFADTYGFSCAVLDCSEDTTPEDFGQGVLVATGTGFPYSQDGKEKSAKDAGYFQASIRRPSQQTHGIMSPLDTQEMAQVVIAKHLDRTSSHVQMQALELIRSRRVFTRTAVYAAPRRFIFLALVSGEGVNDINTLLNDHFFISHYHSMEDGFPMLEESFDVATTDEFLLAKKVSNKLDYFAEQSQPLITLSDFDSLNASATTVKVSADVRSYLHNIVVFMRLHRAVAGGVSALATRHFLSLIYSLAPLHGLNYVTPSLVALAARKIYPHRIVLTRPENERSLQWGSSVAAVQQLLEGLTVEDVIDDVLATVEIPV